MVGNFPRLLVHRPARKYANSNLGMEHQQRIVQSVENQMKQKKVFLDPEITIDRLAELVGCSRHHLSQVLNESMKQSFYEYINYWRVEEAKSLLTDPRQQALKIASIAFDSGFNSISAFNEVFKKFSGQTPSQYKKQTVAYSRKERV